MSPYNGLPKNQWLNKTQALIAQYPLTLQEIHDVALLSWERLWQSQIGDQINLSDVDLPATVVGYFFQKLFAYELSQRYPLTWRGEIDKQDKDLVNITNPDFSTEMKASGQHGFKIFGNRSYNQETAGGYQGGKNKSGYYITINFTGQSLNLIRLGWIDQDDWIPQGAATGQAATLHPDVYVYKMLEINGQYRYTTPVALLNSVGPKLVQYLNERNIYTIYDLHRYNYHDRSVDQIKQKNQYLLTLLFS